MMQVLYNTGTGFLSDDSGMELFYTAKDMEPVGKMIVGHKQSGNQMTVRGEPGYTVSGFCSSQCAAGDSSTRLDITAVSLLAGQKAGNIRLRAMMKIGRLWKQGLGRIISQLDS